MFAIGLLLSSKRSFNSGNLVGFLNDHCEVLSVGNVGQYLLLLLQLYLLLLPQFL